MGRRVVPVLAFAMAGVVTLLAVNPAEANPTDPIYEQKSAARLRAEPQGRRRARNRDASLMPADYADCAYRAIGKQQQYC